MAASLSLAARMVYLGPAREKKTMTTSSLSIFD